MMIGTFRMRNLVLRPMFIHLLLAGTATAQSIPVLPPLPEGSAEKLNPGMESCDETACDVSAAQIVAFDTARKRYAVDPVAAASYSVVFGKEGADIAITLIPSPLGARGRAVTYVFDAAGTELKKSYVNR